jgi:hypothetical protein
MNSKPKLLQNVAVEIFESSKCQFSQQSEKKICLVLPDGYEEEVNFFYDFCNKIIAMSKDFKFIFRIHPRFKDKKLSIKNNYKFDQ